MGNAPAWECQRTVEAAVSVSFAWQYMTNVSNWSDPPAEFELDGPFAAGSRGTTRMPGQPPNTWMIRDVDPGRAYTLEGGSFSTGRYALPLAIRPGVGFQDETHAAARAVGRECGHVHRRHQIRIRTKPRAGNEEHRGRHGARGVRGWSLGKGLALLCHSDECSREMGRRLPRLTRRHESTKTNGGPVVPRNARVAGRSGRRRDRALLVSSPKRPTEETSRPVSARWSTQRDSLRASPFVSVSSCRIRSLRPLSTAFLCRLAPSAVRGSWTG